MNAVIVAPLFPLAVFRSFEVLSTMVEQKEEKIFGLYEESSNAMVVGGYSMQYDVLVSQNKNIKVLETELKFLRKEERCAFVREEREFDKFIFKMETSPEYLAWLATQAH